MAKIGEKKKGAQGICENWKKKKPSFSLKVAHHFKYPMRKKNNFFRIQPFQK